MGARRSDHVLVLALASAGVALAMTQNLVVPALAQFRHDFGASDSAVGWVLTAFLLTSAGSAALAGHLGDRFGTRPVLLSCLGALAGGSFAASASRSFAVL